MDQAGFYRLILEETEDQLLVQGIEARLSISESTTYRQVFGTRRGARIVEVLKQPQYQTMPVEKQIAIIYAVTNGYLDDVPVPDVKKWEEDFHMYVNAHHAQVLGQLAAEKVLSDSLEADLKKAIAGFKALA